jgi:hypothetical protein
LLERQAPARVKLQLPLQVLPPVGYGVNDSNTVRIAGQVLGVGAMPQIAGIPVDGRQDAGAAETFFFADEKGEKGHLIVT